MSSKGVQSEKKSDRARETEHEEENGEKKLRAHGCVQWGQQARHGSLFVARMKSEVRMNGAGVDYATR